MTIALSTAAFAYRPVAAPAALPQIATPAAPAQPARSDASHQSSDLTPAQVIVQANASALAHAAMYDARVLGATETVTSFDRIAMVEKGFEHMRDLFEIANPKGESGAAAQAQGGEASAGVDMRC
jgi:hypothetical protein